MRIAHDRIHAQRRMHEASSPGVAFLILAIAFRFAPAVAADRAAAAVRSIADVDNAAALHRAVLDAQARPPAPILPRAAFLARAQLRAARLSPDGSRVAALVERARVTSVWVATPEQPSGRRIAVRTPADRIAWSRDGRWLFLISAQRVDALAMGGQSGSGIVATLGGPTRLEFVAVDATQDAAVRLLERPARDSSAAKRWRLWRAQPGRRHQLLHDGALPVVDAATADDGRITHLLLAVGGGHAVVHRESTGRWRRLARCEHVEVCRFVGTADAGQTLLLSTNHGADLQRLAALDEHGALRTLAHDPQGEADLDTVVVDPVDGRPRIATYRSTATVNVGLDPDAAAVVQFAQARYPHGDLEFEPARGVGRPWLIQERGAARPVQRLHLLDLQSRSVVDVFADLGVEHDRRAVAGIAPAATALQVPIAWRASDGMRLHGLLTLPSGVDIARAPLVVSVHGGPWSHAAPGWDTQAQFLANRGYVVFAPNFRGSTGFGRRYLLAAGSAFGGGERVQQDIVEGTRWVLGHGVGDATRVAMTGASFGGYSTLLGLTYAPDMFRAGVAIVPPSDFGRVVREYAGSAAEYMPGIPIATSLRDLGVDPNDRRIADRLRSRSPAARANALRAPLLIFAGGEDDRVPIRGVTDYAARLRMRRKDVSLFIDAEAGHNRADPRTSEAALFLQETLLHRVLGGRKPQPAGSALRDHIRRNLRLHGSSLKLL